MDKYIDCKRRKLPEVLCIDEFKNLSCGKGKYACLLLNYETGEIIDVLENRLLDYLQYYFNRIPIDELKGVKYVVSDMYEAYKHLAITTFPNATLVIDAFHYIRYISDALNRIRRRIQEYFGRASNEYKILKKYWKLLTMNSNKLDDKVRSWDYFEYQMSSKEIVKEIRSIHPDINFAYLKKEDFLSSYKKVSFDKAESYLICFINSLKQSNIKELKEVSDTFKNWLPYIVNSFNKDEYGKRMSNGKIEGSNNKIKVIKRVSYGYSDFYHLRNRIMYIFNENEKPLVIPLDLNKIKEIKKIYYKKRKPYVKGFLKSKEKYSNAYSIRKLDQINNPLMTNKEAIEYLNNLHITKSELKELNKWIKDGNNFYSNPFNLYDENGVLSNFLDAIRFTKNKKKKYKK